MQRLVFALFLAGLAALLCVSMPLAALAASDPAPPQPLKIGVTTNYPPIIFLYKNSVSGVEADLALALARQMGKPIQFVELSWEDQIQALLDGRIDIIMSGMSVTEARKVRITFTEPYLKAGLAALTRRVDASRYNSVRAIQERSIRVGVVKGTTGESYARQNLRRASMVVPLPRPSDAADELRDRRIDVFLHDGPSVAWLASENEADLAMIRELINVEYLAWGVRRGDGELLAELNRNIARWKADGTLRKIILKWLPYWREFD